MKKTITIFAVLVMLFACTAAFAQDGYSTFRDETFAETVGKVPEKTGYEKFLDEVFTGFSYDAAKREKSGYEKFRDEVFTGFNYHTKHVEKSGYETFRDGVYPLTATQYPWMRYSVSIVNGVKITKIRGYYVETPEGMKFVPEYEMYGYEYFRDEVF
jgi:hypothetical protein